MSEPRPRPARNIYIVVGRSGTVIACYEDEQEALDYAEDGDRVVQYARIPGVRARTKVGRARAT